MYELMCD